MRGMVFQPKSWQKVKLGEVLKIRRGASPRPIHEYIRTSGMPWLKIADVTGSNSRFVDSTKEFIKEDGISKSVVVRSGDLVLSNSATPGIPRFMRITACVHDGWLILEPNNNLIDKNFLYYRLVIDRKKLISNVTGAIFDNLKTDILRDHQISLPPITDQKHIASILSAFDDKIELNNKINHTLEQMAQAIFKEWFINFRFPGHEKVKFVESEMGKIPEGWEVGKLFDIANIIMGQSPESKYYNDKGDGLPFHQGVTNFGERFPEHKIYCTENSRIGEEGDILLSVRAPVGRINVANTKISLGRGLCAIQPKKDYKSFLFYLLKRLFQKEDSMGSGSVYPAINKKELESIEILIPSEEVAQNFEKIVADMDKKIVLIQTENQSLVSLRDLLLPKLMNGGIRV